MNQQYRNSLLLLITAAIWGSGFVAQALGMEHVGPFTFTWARSLIGGLFLLAAMPLLDRIRGTVRGKTDPNPWKNRTLWIGGFFCGTMLFISESLQQFGIMQTTVAKAGFLTSLYILIVPILGIFLNRKAFWNVWVGVLIAVAGLYLLCVKPGDSLRLSTGDTLVVACAFSFSLHILVIDRFAPLVDAVRLSCLQFFIGSVWGAIMMALFDPPTLEGLIGALGAILFAGVLSNGVAYTLQTVAQKGINPTIASLLMSLESVFGTLAGWLIMNQTLSAREFLGCCVMGAAIVLAQLPPGLFKKRWSLHA